MKKTSCLPCEKCRKDAGLRWLARSIVVSMLVFAAIYAGRGLVLAWLVGGRYAWLNLVVDCGALALIILALRMLDLGVKKLFHHLIGDQTRARKTLAAVASWSVVLVLVVPFVMALAQFHPQKIACIATPADFGIPYSEVLLDSQGLQLSAWHLPASSPERPVVVLCHGLGANKQNFLPMAQMLHRLDLNVVTFDFRGHGNSQGRTITFGVKESQDVKAALDYARARHPSSKMYGVGYSMGGAALVQMAAEHGGFDKIVVDSSFARAENVALHTMLWYFGPLKKPIWHVGRFWGWVFSGVDVAEDNPDESIGKLSNCPIFLIHGTEDNMIPSTESERLREAAGANARLWLVDGMGHLQALGHPEYRERLRQFFEKD
ncbi:MAG: lysophospholipase [Gemmataceae bacterium]|nr:lysophospholipase [Gemmataceae bacterium]